MTWGDRYDARGALIGLLVLLAGGLGLGVALHGGLGAWLASFAIACGTMNVTGHLLRRRARGTGKRPRGAQPVTPAELRRRLPIVAVGVSAVIVAAVAWTLALGNSGTIPAAISGALIGAVMLFAMLRRPADAPERRRAPGEPPKARGLGG